MEIKKILIYAVEREASDLHFSAKLPPYIRINGSLVSTELEPLSPGECKDIAYSMLSPLQIKNFEEKKELDFSYGIKDLGRFRVNLSYQRGSVSIAIRPIKREIPTFSELGLPEEVMVDFTHRPHGLVLICGPTGSGKSTTLAAMIDYINEERACHIVSIEDPIEYLHQHKKALVEQRELGVDTFSFGEASKRVLRQDPDVVLIGEMRDLETIEWALRIAETGHLVLSTLHTGEVIQALGRLIDVFPSSEQKEIATQLSLTLVGIFVQQLLPRMDREGRVLATEVMVTTPAIRNIIREGEFAQIYSHLQIGSNLGMHTINASLAELCRRGEISEEIALSKVTDIKEFKRLIKEKNLRWDGSLT